jgi:ribosomal protein L3 glutamine methyltransferase
LKILQAGSARQVLEQMADAFDAAELFFGHGTDNSWDEACWLLETLRRRHGKPALQEDTPLSATDLAEVNKLFNARIDTRKPLAYLLNEAWFCGVPFYVDERVLVPRSPFAELINNRFAPLLTREPRRILDLCAGGGCIGIACALAFPEAKVVLADISSEALEVARINVTALALQERVELVRSDLFKNVTGKFDLIVTNPPYVAEDEYDELPDEYRQEPRLGLVTDKHGIDIPLRILEQASTYLRPGGLLLLETGATWPLLADARQDLPFLWLEFEHGGEGICALTKEQLDKAG